MKSIFFSLSRESLKSSGYLTQCMWTQPNSYIELSSNIYEIINKCLNIYKLFNWREQHINLYKSCSVLPGLAGYSSPPADDFAIGWWVAFGSLLLCDDYADDRNDGDDGWWLKENWKHQTIDMKISVQRHNNKRQQKPPNTHTIHTYWLYFFLSSSCSL